MNTMRGVFMYGFATFLLLSIFYIAIESKNNAPEPSEFTESFDAPVEVVKKFTSLNELVSDSKLIALVQPLPQEISEAPKYKGLLFSVTPMKLLKVLKGQEPEGTNINVLQFIGGQVQGKLRGFDGKELMNNKQKYFLFLDRYEGPLANDAWVVIGVWQGRLVVRGDGSLAYVGESSDIELNTYFNNMTLNDLENEIMSITSNPRGER